MPLSVYQWHILLYLSKVCIKTCMFTMFINRDLGMTLIFITLTFFLHFKQLVPRIEGKSWEPYMIRCSNVSSIRLN